MNNILESAEQILTEAGKPLHYRMITERMLQQQLWVTRGETPEATVDAKLAVDIKAHGTSSRFQRTDKGVFALRHWSLPEYTSTRHSEAIESNQSEAQLGDRISPSTTSHRTLSFTDAAAYVLEHSNHQQPMHYRDITSRALKLGLLTTQGQTPEATMYAQILTEVARQVRRDEIPRFIKHGRGKVSLSKWKEQEQPKELTALIMQHNHEVRQKLSKHLCTMHPTEFEEFIGELLVALGFEVNVTQPSGDGGIDIYGTLVVGDVIRLHMAVQVKRWKQNIQSPDVQRVRGSLGTHDQGLIITTSDFSDGARREAARADAVPVALMNGEQLVELLIVHNVGVYHTSYDLIELRERRDEAPIKSKMIGLIEI